MFLRYAAAAVAAAFWASLSFAQLSFAQTPALPPVEAFAALPAITNPVLSPDGKRLAMIQARNGRPVATIWTLDPQSPLPLIIPFDNGFIDRVCWANNHRLLVRVNLNARYYGDPVNPWYRTVSIDADTKESVVMFSNREKDRDINYSASHIIDIAPNDPDHIYMSLYSGGGYIAGMYNEPKNTLFRVDVNTGKAVYIETGSAHTVEWIMDGAGNLVARRDMTKDPLVDHIFVRDGDKNWREIASTDASGGQAYNIAGLSQDGKSLVLHAYDENGESNVGLVQMSLADGKISDLYFSRIHNTDGALVDPWTSRVLGVTYTDHLATDDYFDPAFTALQSKLNSAFPGQSVHAVSWNLAVDKIIVSVDGPLVPPTYYFYDRAANVLKSAGKSYAKLTENDLGTVKIYDYKARDGLDIPAYLTLPPHKKEAKNLPVVILPHGGPAARDSMNFDWEAQFLANRGYAVLQPNFRGSTGYGEKFEEAGYGQWGLKMQDDITDGVKKLIADGIADPKRICIAGGSYGGYAALAGAAFTPNLYACAAAWAPVTDLRQQLVAEEHEAGGGDSWLISAENRYIGNRRKDRDKLDDVSPAEKAAQITVPVLLMHGEADSTVRIEQSEIMERALRKAGKKVTFIRLPKETHHMKMAETRQRWLSELEKFLKENIGN